MARTVDQKALGSRREGRPAAQGESAAHNVSSSPPTYLVRRGHGRKLNGKGQLYLGEDFWLALDLLKKSTDVSTKMYRLDEGEEAGTQVAVLLAFKKVSMPVPRV